MDRRIVGAVVAGVAGLAAVGALLTVLVTSNGTSAVAPQSPLLIARTEDSEALYPSGLPDPPPHAIQDHALAPVNPPSPQAPPLADTPTPLANPPLSGTSTQSDLETVPPPSPGGAPPPVKHAPKPPRVVDHKYDGVMTVPEIGRIKSALKLTRDQEAYWPPVASLLRELGRQQMAQIDAGQKPDYNMSSDMMQRFYSAASPLLGTLRDDQKAEVRRRAKSMGLEAFASYI